MKRTALPFPTLSLFAIYSAQPLPESIPADALRNDAALEQSKVLFFSTSGHGPEPITPERRARLMGTVVGMADFARMLSRGDAPAVRSVHSQKQRMVWLEPENGILIHASIELARAPRHSRVASSNSTFSTFSPSLAPPLEDASLLASLQAAYDRFRLTRGTIRRSLEDRGKQATVEMLDDFWTGWTNGWNLESEGGAGSAFERVVGGVPKSSVLNASTLAQLAPLLAQFAASNSSALPILMHGSSVLSLPSLTPTQPNPHSPNPSVDSSAAKPVRPPQPPLTTCDLVALVNYLASLTPPKTTLAVLSPPLAIQSPIPTLKHLPNPLFSEIYGADTTTTPSTASGSPSKWTPWMSAYLHPPSLPTMPSMPSMPSMSIPMIPGLSTSNSERTSTPASTAAESPSGVWSGLRNVGWGTLGLKGHSKKGSQASSITPVDPAAVPLPPADDSEATLLDSKSQPASSTSSPPISTPNLSTDNTLITVPSPPDTAAFPSPIETEPTPTSAELDPPIPASSMDLASSNPSTLLSPASPSLELTPQHLDVEALAQAMHDGLITPPSPSEVASVASFLMRKDSSEESAEHDEPALEVVKVVEPAVEIFCGEGATGDTKAEVRRFNRGTLSLALATLPLADDELEQWLESRSHRLLEAVETVLDLANLAPPLYPHRHLIKTDRMRRGHGWTSAEQQWSGKATVEENEVEAAVFDCFKGFDSHPPIFETFVRTSSSQWVIGRRAEDGAAGTTDVYVVLPPKVGKDGSLVDAGDQLRKLERVYRDV